MKKLISVILTLCALLSFSGYNAFAYSAHSMIVTECVTGTELVGVSADNRMPMASTTKIMTALVTIENADLNARVTVPDKATGIEGSSMYLKKGDVYTVRDLLYGLMLTSGNDAAEALALFVGKTEQDFVLMMNGKAASLGLTNTNFTNPSGLPDDNHYTTARELAYITARALENDTFRQTVSSKTATVTNLKDNTKTTLSNHNRLLRMYDGAIGVKTGYTKKAGRCLVSAAERDGVRLVCVTLNAPDDWNDHMSALDYGFSKVTRVPLCQKGGITVNLETPDGIQVTAHNTDTLYTVSADTETVTCKICAERFIYPPKNKGECVGQVMFYRNGTLVGTDDVVLDADIPAPPPRKELLITRIINFIKRIFK